MAKAAQQRTPYGLWPSPITAQDVAVHAWRPSWTEYVGTELWWTRPTPAEGGRVRLFRASDRGGSVLPQPWNVRTGFTEYGGKPFAGYVGPRGPVVVFTEWSDQRLYLFEPDSADPEPRPLTPEPALPAGFRYVDPQIVADRGEVWCVREEFHSAEPTDVTRSIVAIPLDGSGSIRTLVRDRQRFLANPRRSPDGRRLAWIGWDHPDMPWDSASLHVVELDSHRATHIAGGSGVAIAQAEWTSQDTIAYSSDESGWWSLYVARLDGSAPRCAIRAEEEFAGPAWFPGQRWFLPLGGERLAAIHGHTTTTLSIYDLSGNHPPRHIDAPYTEWTSTLSVHDDTIATFAASPSTYYELVELDTANAQVNIVSPGPDPFAEDWLPKSSERTFLGPDGREIHANVHLPQNPDHIGPADERPPFIVFVHGGPTGHSPLVYDLEVAYFTSRGFGVVDVNYGGSAGYGRAYRERLREQWGVVDVNDCADVVAVLVKEGIADPARVAIRGGSAGGWTTACALVADPEAAVYRCGTIRFPVLDPAEWRTGGTHDFESQYLDGLIGAWPEHADRYRERSPVARADRIAVPFILLQGMQDAVCPPKQTRMLLDRVQGGQVPFAYRAFEGEQHGFRQSSTIVAALEAELSLYGQAMLGADPPGVPRLELRTNWEDGHE